MSSTHSSGEVDDSEKPLGLTEDGINAILREHRTFDSPSGEGLAHTHRMLEDILEHLQVNGEAQRHDLLDRFFQGLSADNPDQLWYPRNKGGEWFADVAAPQLRALPCVTGDESGDVWRFDPSGVDPAALDDEHVTPLAELRGDAEYAAKAKLDDLGVERRTDERKVLRRFWKRIRGNGSVTADTLERAGQGTGVSIEDVAGTLKALPGIERTVEEPPAPEEIAVETMADVLEGYERLEAEPEEVWRYNSPDRGGE